MQVNNQETKPGYPSGSLVEKAIQEREAQIRQAIELGLIDPDSEPYNELGEYSIELDGSDTSLSTQLFDAGYDGGLL